PMPADRHPPALDASPRDTAPVVWCLIGAGGALAAVAVAALLAGALARPGTAPAGASERVRGAAGGVRIDARSPAVPAGASPGAEAPAQAAKEFTPARAAFT